LWVGMSVCIPTYMLASSMIIGGLSWKEAIAMIFLGNVIVAIPMVFNGHAGTKYGIPFPVLGRASFGTMGVHLPSLLRAIVACGWFGIQTWIGGKAILGIISAFSENKALLDSFNMQFICFLIFWLGQMYFVWAGTESIKWMETLAAPLLILIGLGLLGWGIQNGGGISNILASSYEFKKPTVEFYKDGEGGGYKASFNLIKDQQGKVRAKAFRLYLFKKGEDYGKAMAAGAFLPLKENFLSISKNSAATKDGIAVQFQGEDLKHKSSIVTAFKVESPKVDKPTGLLTYLLWLTAMVAYWATLALNIPDITRFSQSQKDQVLGQFIGLPTTMTLYSFIGVAVTCAAIIIFNDILITQDAPWDPVHLINRFEDSPVILVIAQFAIILATLSTNIAANVISPANSFSNLWPSKISFRTGGVITGLVGIFIMPWKLLGMIIGYLLTYGCVLGPVLAILIADYFIIRKAKLDLIDLYRAEGCYSYTLGVNIHALISLFVGVVVVLSGLFVEKFKFLYDTGWFSGFIVSFVLYSILMTIFSAKGTDRAEAVVQNQ
ncbi:NCS1 family nucleobase:cation symporter-1, partial [Candidatus Riflebacteria bacterium]